VSSLPQSAQIAILLGALVGVALPIAERLLPRARPWLPSAVGLGLGWIVFFSNALSFAIGAVLVWAWNRAHRSSEQTYSVAIASGLIAGESILKAGFAMLATAIGLVG
jgi:uncharacterized oligopeptide transporter (OPT) family protein